MADERLNTAAIDALFTLSPWGVALLDADKRYARVNERLATMNGAAADAHVGRTPSEVIPGAGTAIESVIAHVLESKLPMIGIEADPPTGAPDGTRGARISLLPIVDAGNAIGVLGIVEVPS